MRVSAERLTEGFLSPPGFSILRANPSRPLCCPSPRRTWLPIAWALCLSGQGVPGVERVLSRGRVCIEATEWLQTRAPVPELPCR